MILTLFKPAHSNNTMASYAERTKYCKLYKKTYWGGWRSRPQDIIIQNRNAFIESNPGIRPKKWLKRVREKFDEQMKDISWLLDHNEFYHTPNEWIMITSPYTSEDALFLAKGFRQIEPLYSTNANTFVFVIPK